MKRLFYKAYKKIFMTLKYELFNLFSNSSIKAYWYNGATNFGDALNPLFISTLSDKKVDWIDPDYFRYRNYIVIGSILHLANKHSIVWGAGFLREENKVVKPYKVCAVRGPLSRKKLLDSGVDCPEVYGDPALLLPLIYYPKIKKEYKLGIIPHIYDQSSEWIKNLSNPNVKIIDVLNPDPMKFIDELLSCEQIASSSLHGIIVADAYKIPSLWLEFSDKLEGGGFKFNDYFQSVKRVDTEAFRVNSETNIEEIFESFSPYQIDIDLEKLLNACPFELSSNFREKLNSNKVK